VPDDAAAFKAFESAGWSARAATYGVLMARATVRAAEALLAPVEPGTRLLDVGAGLGDLCAEATKRGAIATGIDLAPDMVRTARERHPGLSFLEGDAEALPFEDQAFDVATGAFVINHLPHPEQAVAEMRRVARRVSLAMWAEDTLLFKLPTEASPNTEIAGPDAERFASRENLLALLPGEVTEIAFELELDSFDALWDGLLGGTVRTAARLTDAMRDSLRALAEPYRRGNGYALPTTVRVVTACSDRPGP
jgi:SAM-dependent methyltransferase